MSDQWPPLNEFLGLAAGILIIISLSVGLVFLAVLGAIGARTGGADVVRTTARVTFWGALAMAAALSQ